MLRDEACLLRKDEVPRVIHSPGEDALAQAVLKEGPESRMAVQVHWLRVILDEGHMLGASLAMTNKLSMAINLKAERRWIMTGVQPCSCQPSFQWNID